MCVYCVKQCITQSFHIHMVQCVNLWVDQDCQKDKVNEAPAVYPSYYQSTTLDHMVHSMDITKRNKGKHIPSGHLT